MGVEQFVLFEMDFLDHDVRVIAKVTRVVDLGGVNQPAAVGHRVLPARHEVALVVEAAEGQLALLHQHVLVLPTLYRVLCHAVLGQRVCAHALAVVGQADVVPVP